MFFPAFLLGACLLSAQDLPTPGSLFAKPGTKNSTPTRGIGIEYERHPNYEMEGGADEAGNNLVNDVERRERMEARIGIPFILKDNFRVLGTLYHSRERYVFSDLDPSNFAFQAIDNTTLKRGRATLHVLGSLGEHHYLAFRGDISSNGAYEKFVDFDSRYLVYRGAVAFGFKRRDGYEDLAFGLMYSNGFARNLVYPFIVYDRTFDDRWGIETLLPLKASLRYNFSPTNMLLLTSEYRSFAYSLDLMPNGATDPQHYIFKSSGVQFYLDWQSRFLTSLTWFSLRTGYAWNFDSRFFLEGTKDGGQIDAFPSGSIFVAAEFFLSPPQKDNY